MMKRHLFIPSKVDYVRGNRPQVDCILCSIVEHDKRVVDSEIFSTKLMTVALNLYPYNPGHLMIFPNRHIVSIEEMTEHEVIEMHRLTVLSIKILRENYNAQDFNIGYNIGKSAGASIRHLHRHIVPRYRSELGFVDILSGSKIFIEDPKSALKKLKVAFDLESGSQ